MVLVVQVVQIGAQRRKNKKVCINVSMRYGYQIQGVLEDRNQEIIGFRVVVVFSSQHFYTVDAPAELFDLGTLQYIKFRLAVNPYMDVRKLPASIQNKIRTPLGRFLDFWVLENTDGHLSERKDTNT